MIRPAYRETVRRASLDGVNALNELNYKAIGDPQTQTRIQQYELAYRMQSSVPELTDLASEPESTFNLYGEGGERAGHVCEHGAAGAADGGAWRAIRADLSQQLGHTLERGRPAARPMPRRRPAVLRPDSRPQATRHVGRYAGGLGRRVRADDLLAGWTFGAKLRARSSPALLHDVDGRRRLQRRHGVRRDGRFLLQHRQRPGPRARLPRHRACTSWASITSGSRSRTRGSIRS